MVPTLNFIARALSSSVRNVDVAVNPDKNIRNAKILEYPKQALYFIASFIALVSLCHFLSLGNRYSTRNRASEEGRRASISAFKLPAALVDTFRALFFRWTIPFAWSFTLNLAELGVTLGYIGVLFSWTFVNSMFYGTPLEYQLVLRFRLFRHIDHGRTSRPPILCR